MPTQAQMHQSGYDAAEEARDPEADWTETFRNALGDTDDLTGRQQQKLEASFEQGWEEYFRIHGEGVDLSYNPGGAGRWGA